SLCEYNSLEILQTQIPLAKLWLLVADNLCGELEGMTDSLEMVCSKTRGACTGRAGGR
ncbi:hypothetical protein K474DRAFT_1667976, partial [Panus rudis PR-1116 ss-1]